MTPEDYEAFTRNLTDALAADARVIGVVALGSMARSDYEPDEWSDHDFFVVARPDAAEAMRTDLTWLPDFGDVVLAARETAHGLKVIFRSGHLAELAVFTPEELSLAR